MKKYEDATAIASNFGPISREERERIVGKAESFSIALLDAYMHGISFLDDMKIRCEEKDEMRKFTFTDRYARIEIHPPTFNDISREDFQRLSDIAKLKKGRVK